MKITIIIPCHNEERSIRATVESCLAQTRPADEIVIVNDGSTDTTAEILASFGDKISVINIAVATGNKSHAQEHGLKYISGDVFITTDGDTILDKDFVKYIEQDFRNPNITAVAGYVRSRPYNWLTACRAYEYAVGQNLHKLAQQHLRYLFIIPGAAGAFRANKFFKHITFEHDTLTEDLDFTYRLHRQNLKVHYDRRLVVFTQDPTTLSGYANQMRRWYAGGWQCLLKHKDLTWKRPRIAFEITLMYLEGILFSVLLFTIPFLSLRYFLYFLVSYMIVAVCFAIFAAIAEKRKDMLLIPIPYLLLVFINSYVFLEQMFRVVFLRDKKLYWFKPQRVSMD